MLLPGDQIGIKIRPFNSTLSSSILSIYLKCKDYRILYLGHRGSKTSNSGGSSPTYSEQKSQISNDQSGLVWNLRFIQLNLFGTWCLGFGACPYSYLRASMGLSMEAFRAG